jgi:FtsP/CotA-like multicopper oxidase with cupredoxin domain
VIASLGPPGTTNIGVLSPDIFDTCTPSKGSHETIHVNPLQGNQWAAFSIISSAGLMTLTVSIDEHPMWIVAVDGSYIEPMKVDAITVANGDRYKVFVELKRTPERKDYTIRVASASAAQIIYGLATISYDNFYGREPEGDSTPYIDPIGVNTTADVVYYNQAAQRNVDAPPVSQQVSQTYIMDLGIAGQTYQWSINASTRYDQDFSENEIPLLFQSPDKVNTHNNLTITTKNGTWTDLIFRASMPGTPPHPLHKHSNKVYILGSGVGVFNYSSVAEAAAALPKGTFNLENPPLRDGFATLPVADQPVWLAVRYQSQNPGAWLLHCHIQSHLNGGMAAVILDGIDAWPTVPKEYLN